LAHAQCFAQVCSNVWNVTSDVSLYWLIDGVQVSAKVLKAGEALAGVSKATDTLRTVLEVSNALFARRDTFEDVLGAINKISDAA